MPTPISQTFREAFLTSADSAHTMSFADFMRLALYHPQLGYYRQTRQRVGYAPGTDFYTASTSGPLFGQLVAAACASLVRAHGDTPETHTFVEIGAETDAGVLAGVEHPFATARTVRVGAPLEITDPCVVFSNELFDAQPCRRFVRRDESWRELGVALRDDQLHEVELGAVAESWLPAAAPDGYLFDAPRDAATLLGEIAGQPWRGLFVALDYGKSWAALAEETPGGTARAYHRHRQHNDLLAQPGEQDLTCHLCWDWLEHALEQNRFGTPTLEAQEAFFVRHAGEFIAATMAAEAGRMSPKKLSLMQLIHPANLGRKFQALHAWRP